MIAIPRRGRGRQSAEAEANFEAERAAFADGLIEINSTLNFAVSSRGWCYILEEHGLTKGEFDRAQRLINDCRKDGLLPINFTKEDDSRSAEVVDDHVDEESPDEYAEDVVDRIRYQARYYKPISFWDTQPYYVEMAVEKIDLKSLFGPLCRQYHIAIQNVKGWSDINSRAAMAERFLYHEGEGRECVLLYCGDHDPGGLNISNSLIENFHQIENGTGYDPSELTVDRFGLNYDFIEANALSWIDNLETSSGGDLSDRRHKDHGKPYVQSYLAQYGARKVEANALVVRPDAGRAMCESAILKYIDIDARERYEEELRGARATVESAIVELMKGAAA